MEKKGVNRSLFEDSMILQVCYKLGAGEMAHQSRALAVYFRGREFKSQHPDQTAYNCL